MIKSFAITVLFSFMFLFPGPAVAKKIINSRFITTDTVWEGDITVNGIVKVAQGATLTIKAGTVISFTRRDADEDGVGENALFLQGKLLAKGTKDSPIIFTSAENQKKRGDWDGINIIVSDRVQNIMEYCRIEYAVRGLHSHFSNLYLANCRFSNNFRAIYFQEAKAVIENSHIVGNLSGLRCRDSELVIKNNEFSDNYWGADILHSRALISGNRFADNILYGLRVREGRSDILGNIFQMSQLGVRFQDSVIRMENNEINGNYETGISFLSSVVVAQSNNIGGNLSAGVLARQSTLYFSGNTLANNGVGFSLLDSQADFADNLISSNRGNGIAANESRLHLQNNRITGNENGIRIKYSPSTDMSGNRIERNRKNGVSADGSQVASYNDFIAGNENGLSAKKSRIVLRQTTLKNNRVAGLDITEGSSASVYTSLVTGNKVVGITAGNHALDVVETEVTQNGIGIKIDNSRSIAVIGCTVSNNKRSGIRIERGKGMIVQSTVDNNLRGIIYLFSDLAITENHIRGNHQYGVLATESLSVLSGNKIEDNHVGLALERSQSAVVDGNTVRGNTEFGITVKDASSASISGNWIYDNGTGIEASGSQIKFSGNSLEKNRDMAFSILGLDDVDAEGNWWGTVDESEIEKMIYDANDAEYYGEVFFFPYLRESPHIPGIELDKH